ncbi:MAG: hypothetical protein U0L59_02255 [Faecalimonas sp.]|nr:hypothetical protein [Faecalimonas sp.]
MNQDNIHDALNMLDDELINEVSKLRDIRKKRKNMSLRLGAIAACLCLLMVSVYVFGNGQLKLGGADKGSAIQEDMSIGSADGTEDFEDTDKSSVGTSAENQSSKQEAAEDEKTWERVESSKNFRRISLAIPTGWRYTTSIGGDASSEEFGISFWPEGEKDSAIDVGYHSAWGVCGTGLEQTKITLGDYSAVQGTYDNKEVWDFIQFHVEDTKGSYVALSVRAETWWDEYGTEAMEILATIKITEGVDVEYLD